MTSLRAAVRAYLAMRRDLGFHLRESGRLLLQFVAFMEQHRATTITTPLALAWAQQPQTVQPAEWARRLSMVRIFARYRRAFDPRTEIPPDGLLPYRPKRARPYLYSDEEIRRLVRAARTMPYRYQRGALRPWVYSCLFGLLSVSGLRLGDARNLELHDVDLQAAVLTIRGAKFGKTRLVPLHPSACKALADYLRRRQQHWEGRPVSSYVFVSSGGNRLDVGDIHRTFYVLSRQIGLRGHADCHGPRIHDLRQHAGFRIMPGLSTKRSFPRAGHQFSACRFGIIRLVSSPRLVGRGGRRTCWRRILRSATRARNVGSSTRTSIRSPRT